MDALTPAQVTQHFIDLGRTKVRQSFHVTFFKAWMAGWMVCFGAMLYQVVQAGSPGFRASNPALVTLIGAFFFPAGLIMIVTTGQDLLTAHLMYMPMSLMHGRIRLWQGLLTWVNVFCGNLAGALCCVAFMAHFSGLYTGPLLEYAQKMSVSKTSQGFGPCLLRGIGCNFLVCVAVWLGASAREVMSKIMGIHFPVFLFVFLGFEHVVVNMYYVPLGMLSGAEVSMGRYLGQSLVPSLIGNILGGILLGVPMVLFHAPPELRLPLFRNGKALSEPYESSSVPVSETSTPAVSLKPAVDGS
ncbi:Formate/nitrite transporter [Cutaneotrichosporon oleaginosum]|uniref:Formate/nitrite transporter n=1 Tax=Cutaneotrichosporon oleaginosum TaxID=879819 RepID=A0A0J0XGJ8_9TREE|nr:Formate/nitrite transporter [Cutaneotrichosporon oleaginosum]KLT40186.1 Formate/nitrite transporter [Cutaneotrichosporon oleaginosum]TXT10523.1 hypothetical protein COLE_04457 [Cutaneotrichosporon oleaginosum]